MRRAPADVRDEGRARTKVRPGLCTDRLAPARALRIPRQLGPL
ncbi:MAG: hypothetical protein ACYTEZ_10700 [Planctomycetota bacterium]